MSQQAIDLLDVSALPAEEGVRQLVETGLKLQASDLMYVANEQTVAVQIRQLGLIRNLSVLEPALGRRHMQHIKARAGIEVSEHRRPLDGRWLFEGTAGNYVDLRINTLPTLYGEDFSIRMLDRERGLFSVDQLGMCPEQLAEYTAAVDNVGGLILVTGPTGSGKSATLYATLRRLQDGSRKLNTIEDPVEFALDGIRQSQVNPAIGLNFAELLRAVLRQSPDVVMIGEIRDAETAQTAVQAANSGTLVMATLHAPAPTAAVQSLRSMGVNPQFLAASLRCIVGQRLLRTLCPKCRETIDLDDVTMAFDEIRPWLKPGEGKNLYAAAGCEACRGVGYSGLTGVFEVMPVGREMRNLIADARPSADLRAQAIREGMIQFRHAAMLKVARGITCTEEVFRVIPSEHLLVEE